MDAPGFCPYVGLDPFAEADRAYFFGRERDARLIVANLDAAKLTVFYGPSGVGKSSVLMAGAVPLLRTRSRTIVVVYREWQRPDAAEALARAIVEATKVVLGGPWEPPADIPLDELLRRAGDAVGGRVAVILDQFEEYSTYFPPGSAASLDAPLARAVNRNDVDCAFMFSLREDALSTLDRFRGRIPNLLENRLRLSHLDRSAAEQAIRGPILRFNAAHAVDPPHVIEDALVEAILEQVRSGRVHLASQDARDATSPSPSPRGEIETPFLQLVMTTLWEAEAAAGSRALRLTTLVALGNAERIVRNHLDGVLATQPPSVQEVCARCFDRLVTPSGTKIALALDDLRNYAGELGDGVPAAVAMLVDRRILRAISPPPPRPVQYELFHDVLAPAALAWRNRYFLLQAQREQAQQAAAREAAHAKELAAARLLAEAQRRATDEATARQHVEEARATDAIRRQRSQARWSLALGACMAVAVAVAVYAWRKAVDADLQHRAADAGRLAADSQVQLELAPEHALLLATEAVRRAPERHSTRALLMAAERVATAALDAQQATILRGSGAQVSVMTPSPDGRIVALGGVDGTITLSALDANGAPVVLDGHTEPVSALAFSPNGRRVASASSEASVRIWERTTGRSSRLDFRGEVGALAFDPEGRLLAVGSMNGTAELWDVERNERVGLPFEGHGGSINAVAFSPDGRRLATASVDGTAGVWDLGQPAHPRIGSLAHEAPVLDVAFSPDGALIATASFDASAGLWDARDLSPRVRLAEHKGPVTSVAFSPDNRYLATGSDDATVMVWDLRGKRVAVHRRSDVPVTMVAFSEGEEPLLLYGNADGTVIRRDPQATDDAQARAALVHGSKVASIAIGANGALIATVNNDSTRNASTVVLWDAATRKAIALLPDLAELAYYTNVAFSRDGTLLAAGSKTGNPTALVWDVATRRVKTRLEDGDGTATSVAFGPVGAILAAGVYDPAAGRARVTLWDVAQRRTLDPIEVAPGQQVPALAFSPDGSLLAVLGSGPEQDVTSITLWRVATRERVAILPARRDAPFTSLAFSPDGRWLAAASLTPKGTAPSIAVFDVTEDKPVAASFDGPQGAVASVTFTTDGQLLATAGVDGSVQLWDLATRAVRGPPLVAGNELPINAIAAAPQGRQLVLGLAHPMPLVWDLDAGRDAWAAVACKLAARNLTCDEWKNAGLVEDYRPTCPGLPTPDPCTGTR